MIVDPELLASALRGRGLGEREYAELARYGTALSLREGRPFAWQGDPVDRALLVLSGRILPVKYRLGAPPVTLPSVGVGEWICLAELLSSSPAFADYGAGADTQVLSFPAMNLAILRARASIERWISLSLARTVGSIHAWLGEGGPRERIISFLLSRQRTLATLEIRRISVTQADMARTLGLSRETVNKRLAELEQQGLISVVRSGIEVPDWDALAAALEP